MRKALGNYSTLPRIPLVSFVQAARYTPLSSYTLAHFLDWGSEIARYFFKRRHPFVTYSTIAGSDRGVYRMENDVSVNLAGDWATGTEEAALVAGRMQLQRAAYNIHLGDVYYVGGVKEVNENFLGVKVSEYNPVKWPTAEVRSFSLLGNHDMYANGTGYFDVLLPALKQEASYFCLQNDNWRIVALDTGYNSGGTQIDSIIKPSCKIPSEVIEWLRDDVNLAGDKRGLILLTHHNPFSDFETAYPDCVKQLASFVNRPVLWFWGHEHRVAVYGKVGLDGVQINGRCIGHGGMPTKLKQPRNHYPILFTDLRSFKNSEGLHVGYNGFANLNFSGPNLRVDYLDLTGQRVFVEVWTAAQLS